MLFAVHLSDGAIATPWLIGGFVGAAILLLIACFKLTEEWIPRIGVLSAAFFVASSLRIPFAIVPTSVHPILNGPVGVILGRRAPLAIAIGLMLQYFLVAHGGLTTLGLNACIIGVPAVAAGWLYPLLRKVRVPTFLRGAILGGSAVAASAIIDYFVLLAGGKEEWITLAQLVLVAHIPIVIIEGLLLGVIVQYVEKVKPELLRATTATASVPRDELREGTPRPPQRTTDSIRSNGDTGSSPPATSRAR
ncbi:MAG TPA: CbiM family transporter [Gemmataceae bacterium]|jgi:cobalt/nickel transport system permease protein